VIRREALRLVAIWLALSQSGCATIRQTLKKRPEGEWVVAEFDRYAKMADQLRKNHASGTLDDKAVRDVLRKIGIATAPERRPGAPPPTPPRPFPVPTYSDGYRWPLDAGIVSAEFGQLRHGTPHQGIDIAAELRVPVYAAGAGEVVYAGDQLSGYGNVIILRHDQKTTTLYGHNSELKIKTGQQVKADEVVALLGSTGRSTGPHLHFEIRQNEAATNPRKYLPKSRF
jgi:murein DD-endopeptidase MepM/ murein hydrolase activator NlpD